MGESDDAREPSPPLAESAEGLEKTLTAGGDVAPRAPLPAGVALPTDLTELPTVDPTFYKVAGEVARGGLGRILEARDRRLDRPVALKQLLHEHSIGAHRFVREALVTARLQHPAIVPVYEAGRWPDGEPFYAMKLVNGRSLKEVIDETRGLDERLALLPNVIAVADAIAYAHSEGVIHRDLKPSNVLIGPFGETVVIDWGLAKDLRAQEEAVGGPAAPTPLVSAPLTLAGSVMGTPHYMPPEQARGEEVTERADVYALGALLYHVLAGVSPYLGADPAQVLTQVLTVAPAPVEQLQPGLPEDLAAVVHKAMARHPLDRYPSARELAEDLKRFQTGKLVQAHEYAWHTLLGRWLRRHRVPVAMAAIFLLVLAVSGALALRRIVQEGRRAAASRNRLILTQAHTSLAGDPTEALAWLKSYPADGEDWETAGTIAADAVSRGVARHPLRGHTYNVSRLALSPDGSTLATGAGDKTVRLWDVESGASLAVLRSPAEVYALAWSPSGSHLAASGGEDGAVRLWEVATRQSHELSGHRDAVPWLVFSPDSRWLATASLDGTVRLWDVGTREARVLQGHEAGVEQVAFSPDGSLLVSVGRDRTVRLWELDSGQHRLLHTHEDTVERVAFSPDGTRIASAGEDRTVRLYERSTGRVRVLHGHEEPVRALAFSPDGQQLASSGDDGTVRRWEVASGVAQVLRGHEGALFDLAFSPDGSLLASAGQDGTVRLWGQEGLLRVLRGHTGDVNHLRFSSDGHWLASASDDRTVRLWELEEVPRVLRGHRGNVLRVIYSPDGRRLASCDSEANIWVWDRATGEGTLLRGHEGLVQGLDFSPDGRRLASASWDKTIRVWDLGGGGVMVLRSPSTAQRVKFLADGQRLVTAGTDGELRLWRSPEEYRVLGRHDSGVYGLALAPDGQRLASAGEDRTVRLWDLSTGEERVLRGHKDEVLRVVFSPDGRWLASGSRDATVRLWSVEAGTGRVLGSHEGHVEGLAFSPDGARLASSGTEGLVQLWELGSGAMRPLRGHEERIRDVAFSPDGRWLASASYDQTVRLWDVDTGATRLLRGHAGYAMSVAFAPDGAELASSGTDATVRLWSPRRDTLVPREREALQAWLERTTTARLLAPPDIPTP